MKIGFVGLGAMGGPIAANLQRAGHELQAYDLRSVEGFNLRKSPAEAARDCDVLFSSLPGPKEVAALAKEVAPVMKKGSAWFDLSTNSPECVRGIEKDLAPKGIDVLDAPVSGGPAGAKSGKLAIWVGGKKAVFERLLPVLKAASDQPYYVGPIGAGTVAKLAHNAASFALQAALAEIFTLGVKAGVEPADLLGAIRQGASGRKRTFDRLPEFWLRGKFDPPAFSLALAHKDMTLALELAEKCGVPMRIGKIALEELEEGLKRGWAGRDSRVTMTLQEERAGVSVVVPEDKLRAVLDEGTKPAA
jgi:3-hydroxyisobutyrate dehydrogenase